MTDTNPKSEPGSQYVFLLLDLWMAMGGDDADFHPWWAADPSFADRWSQLVAAVGGNVSGLAADSNPPAGTLLDVAIAFQPSPLAPSAARQAEKILRSIAEDVQGPLTWSNEGLDDCCFFCGVDRMRYTDDTSSTRFVEHKATCDWVMARRLFGMDIAPHTVAGQP